MLGVINKTSYRINNYYKKYKTSPKDTCILPIFHQVKKKKKNCLLSILSMTCLYILTLASVPRCLHATRCKGRDHSFCQLSSAVVERLAFARFNLPDRDRIHVLASQTLLWVASQPWMGTGIEVHPCSLL